MNNYQNFSIDDIIFENRNKAYGAYQLRQIVDKHTTYGLLVTTTVILVLILIISMIPNSQNAIFRNPVNVAPQELLVEIIKPKPPTVIPPKQLTKAATVPTKAFTTVEPTTTTSDVAPPKQDDLLTAMVSTVENNNTSTTATVSTTSTSSGIELNTTFSTVDLPVSQKIEKWVEIMPTFIGGNEALMKYLKKNITMDSRDIESGVSGKVVVQFYVDIDGSIKEAKVIKDNAGGRCAERALAVINKMPKWNPGKQGDKAVRVYYSIPITFQVN